MLDSNFIAFAIRALGTLGAAGGLAPLPAAAQAATEVPPALADAPVRKEVTVSTTRTPRDLDDFPAVVTILHADDIEARGPRDIKDAFRDEIDLTVRAAPTRCNAGSSATGRAGSEGIDVRVLAGDQVLLLVDGIRVPNAFSFGPFSTGHGDFLAVEDAGAIEVLRSPAALALAEARPPADRRFDTLSGGEQARGQLARAFAPLWHECGGVLLIDEPLTALDPRLQFGWMDALQRFARERLHSVIVVLHDPSRVFAGFERLWLVEAGRLVGALAGDAAALPALERPYGIRLAWIDEAHGEPAIVARRDPARRWPASSAPPLEPPDASTSSTLEPA